MDRDTMTRLENETIYDFLSDNKKYITGKVLDYGAGHMPYRDFIKRLDAVDMYIPLDSSDNPASRVLPGTFMEKKKNISRGTFDTVVCTQVLQYTYEPTRMARDIYNFLRPEGYVIVTFPTNWPEIEEEDLLRYTAAGVRKIFSVSGFTEVLSKDRYLEDFKSGGGYVGRSGWDNSGTGNTR